jgi:hypothetical protein
MADYQMPSFAFEIPADAIKAVEIEDATSIERKVTPGRMSVKIMAGKFE